MNTEFEQWVFSHRILTGGFDAEPEAVYKYLQANPHLLREDGEKEYDEFNPDVKVSYGKPSGIVLVPKVDNHRPTDIETEAKEMMDKYSWWRDAAHSLAKCCFQADAITALTEFGKMWYERGSREGKKEEYDAWVKWWNSKESDHMKEVEELQQQLAEKDKWISVEDRLPEKNDYYLVISEDEDGLQDISKTWFNGKELGFYINYVTHWQSLPSPPKTDNK